MHISRLLFRTFLGKRLPTMGGTLAVSGAEHDISIQRDAYGIPYIRAENWRDAWYGLGFCQGQDRAFQIELMLRAQRGTLAALLGADYVPVDRLSRRIGFHRTAQRQIDLLGDYAQTVLEAFSKGVQEGVTEGLDRRPHEFVLLREEPTPYEPADVLGVMGLLSFTLPSNWDAELVRLKMLMEDGPEAVEKLEPNYPEWLPVTDPPSMPAGETVDGLAEDLAVLQEVMGHGGGSNNWAVNGRKTRTGRPLLANDPHLAATLPPHWYLGHLRTPDGAVAGAALAGGPGIVAGHNGYGAWGVTAGMVDTTDLFIEEIGSDAQSVRGPNGYENCEVITETIEVRGEEPVEEDVLITPRGPVISPALEPEMGAISLSASWLNETPINGFLTAHKKRSFGAFRRTFEDWPILPLNVVYADESDTIGWQLAADPPLRKSGLGMVPQPGWLPDVGWEDGGHPFDDLPKLKNPECGFVATANNRPRRRENQIFLGGDWLDGYRLAAIGEALSARDDWDCAGFQELQESQKSLPWMEIRARVVTLQSSDESVQKGLQLLRDWNGHVTAESIGATVFELFTNRMIRRIVEAQAPHSSRWALGEGFNPMVPRTMFSIRRFGQMVRLINEQPDDWFEDSWENVMCEVMKEVVDQLEAEHGADPADWKWGEVRTLTLEHPASAGSSFVEPIFNRGPFPCGGDTNTINQRTVRPLNPTANPLFIPSMRMVVDVGNWDDMRVSLPGGQSGNPLSPHYDDLLEYWHKGEGVRLAWTEARIEDRTVHTLRLQT